MGTEIAPGAGDRGWTDFAWSDRGGIDWRAEIGWTETAPGVILPTRVTLDSQGRRAVTSTVLREFEPVLRKKKEQRVEQVRRAAALTGDDDVIQRAHRQVAAYEAGLVADDAAPAPARRGRPKEHDLWLDRVLVLWQARRDGRPQLQALMETEKLTNQDTARVYVRRARKWDRESGLNLLTGPADEPRKVARAVQAARAMNSTNTKGRKA